jgi:hypothetical protein
LRRELWLLQCVHVVAKSSKKRGENTRGVKRVSKDRSLIGKLNLVVLDAIRKAQ